MVNIEVHDDGQEEGRSSQKDDFCLALNVQGFYIELVTQFNTCTFANMGHARVWSLE